MGADAEYRKKRALIHQFMTFLFFCDVDHSSSHGFTDEA